MKKVTLRFRSDDGSLIELMDGCFDEKHIEVLTSFVRYMKRLRASSFLQKGLPSLTNIHWSESGLKITCRAFEDSDLHELLHVLRPLILHREQTSFNNIVALLQRSFSNRLFSNRLKEIRSVFDHGELRGYMQITLADQKLFDASLLDLWLYAEQYHTDPAKQTAWAELKIALTEENARAVVITQLQGKVKALFELEYLVDMVVKP